MPVLSQEISSLYLDCVSINLPDMILCTLADFSETPLLLLSRNLEPSGQI